MSAVIVVANDVVAWRDRKPSKLDMKKRWFLPL